MPSKKKNVKATLESQLNNLFANILNGENESTEINRQPPNVKALPVNSSALPVNGENHAIKTSDESAKTPTTVQEPCAKPKDRPRKTNACSKPISESSKAISARSKPKKTKTSDKRKRDNNCELSDDNIPAMKCKELNGVLRNAQNTQTETGAKQGTQKKVTFGGTEIFVDDTCRLLPSRQFECSSCFEKFEHRYAYIRHTSKRGCEKYPSLASLLDEIYHFVLRR